MTTLSDIRSRVRQDLHDTDPANERWDDDQLDRHIAHALSDIDLALPREQSATISTTPGSRDLDISGLAGLINIEAVEYPAGTFPPSYVRFSTWEQVLSLLIAFEPDGSDARILYTARHIVDDSSSTVPSHLEDALAMGAAGYAAMELANGSINVLNFGGADVVADYRAWGQAWLTAFRQLLGQNGRSNRVQQRRLFVPA